MDQPGKVANPARGQLNRENNIPLSPCVPENLVSRDGFSRPVPRQPAHLHTQAESGAYLRDSSRVPRMSYFGCGWSRQYCPAAAVVFSFRVVLPVCVCRCVYLMFVESIGGWVIGAFLYCRPHSLAISVGILYCALGFLTGVFF